MACNIGGAPGEYRLLTVVISALALAVSMLALYNPGVVRPGEGLRTTPAHDGPVDFSVAAEAVMPALVKVENLALGEHPEIPAFGAAVEVPHTSDGTGFFIDKEGLVLTNFHVVDGAQVLKVVTRGQREYPAELVGSDPLTDIALIRIKPDFDVKPVVLGDSDSLKVGQWVLAMGNPLGLEFFTSAGIISGFGPPGAGYVGIYDFIQVDVNIEPGNSGGPLVDYQGRVVGINNAYLGPGTGIGFSIPIKRAIDILPALRTRGAVSRGFLGLVAQSLTPGLAERLGLAGTEGALISGVQEGSPADKAGLRAGDVVVSFNRNPVKDDRGFYERINNSPAYAKVSLGIIRDGRRKNMDALLGELKPRQIASQRVIRQCGITLKEVDKEIAARLGLPKPGGLMVLKVVPGCPSFEAGLKFGDIILKVEDAEVNTIEGFYREYSKSKRGSQVLIQVYRDGRPQFLTIEQLG